MILKYNGIATSVIYIFCINIYVITDMIICVWGEAGISVFIYIEEETLLTLSLIFIFAFFL